MPLWTLICICRCAIKFVEVYVARILQVFTGKFGGYIESKNLYLEVSIGG
jgi:hypothetical protein